MWSEDGGGVNGGECATRCPLQPRSAAPWSRQMCKMSNGLESVLLRSLQGQRPARRLLIGTARRRVRELVPLAAGPRAIGMRTMAQQGP